MLDRLSGKILHIDFGDCFEVTGLDGNYRTTCHTVMEVLREHKDSVMAVLEAFVYDPLLNWRLMDIGDGLVKPEALNKKAIQIINRVRDKLTGVPSGNQSLANHSISSEAFVPWSVLPVD
ncbi:hypothetical protein A6R68_14014 [Neotoma lepida]|uniref:PI3K/PI4K catalytic domain-containing protein n=1 Tax=Neotoma lepida TaxID=56216 RepID=A0A1A6HCX3_NEOLE|nr:hypothetical protein A6R68_14014 [Neotoma lepida]